MCRTMKRITELEKPTELLGEEEKAKQYFQLASLGDDTPSSVLYYNDQPSDYIYYMGLAQRELGKEDLAKKSLPSAPFLWAAPYFR